MKNWLVYLILPLMVTPAAAADCGFIGRLIGVCAAVESAQEEIKQLRGQVKETADAAIRAVPGERYLQIIDKLYSADLKQVEEARALLLRMANVEKDATYQAIINVEYSEPETPFSYDVFRGKLPSRATVQALSDQNSIALTKAASRSGPAETFTELKARVKSKITQSLDTLSGPLSTVNTNIRTGEDCCYSYPGFSGNYFGADYTFSTPEKVREEFSSVLADAVTETLADRTQNLNAPLARSMPWDPIDPSPYVFLVMPENDYNAHQNIRFFVGVNDTKDAGRRLYDRPTYVIDKARFDPKVYSPVVHPVLGKLYWTYVEMTGSLTLSPQAVQDIEALRKTLAELDKPATD